MNHHDSAYHMGTRDKVLADLDNDSNAKEEVSDSAMSTLDEEGAHPEEDSMVFSSLDTHFSLAVCIEQYIFHVFFPLTVPIAWYRYGMKHAHIQRYHYRDPFALMVAFIPCICMSSAIFCLLAEPDVLKVEMMMLPFGVFLLQRMMIAVKYASLSPHEYRAFISIGGTGFFSKLSPADYRTSTRHTSLMQLNSGWIVIPDALIRHELVVSSLVQGIDLSDLFFYVPVSAASSTREPYPEKMYNDWMRLLKEPGSEYNLKRERSGASNTSGSGGDGGGAGSAGLQGRQARGAPRARAPRAEWSRTRDGQFLKVNCMDVCEYMFHVLNKRVGGILKFSIGVALLLALAIVYNYWAWYSWMFKHSIYTKVFLIADMYLLFVFFPILLLFYVAAVTDVYRRYEIGRMLRELITVSDVKMVDSRMYDRFHSSRRRKEAVKSYTCAAEETKISFQSFSSTALPRVDMSMPANYVSWCMCRQVLARFGNRFLFRTNLYMGILALLVLIQVVNTLINIFFSSLSADDVCHTFNFASTVLSVAVVAALLCVLMTGITMTNRRMQKHRIQISTHLLHANKALHELMFRDSMCDDHGLNNSCTNHRKSQRSMENLASSDEHLGEATAQLRECIESANAVVQTLAEYDDVEPLKFLNMHVEKEHIISVASSMVVYGLVLYSFCVDGGQIVS